MITFLAYLSSILVFLPLCLGIYSYMKNGSNLIFNLLLCIFIVSGVIEIISLYLSRHNANNHFWINLWYFLTTILFIAYYCLIIIFKNEKLYYLVGVYIIGVLFWFSNYGSMNLASAPFIIVSSIILIAFSAFYLIQLFNQEDENLFRLHEFWISVGIMVFSTGSLMYWSFFPIFMNSHDNSFILNIYIVFTVINIIGNLLYSIAFICRIRTYKIKFNLQ